ncbi:DUF3311 domain-containing protein [Calidifontibacter sp. DB0510]|uniref:DUF3311 domain-containing protein n=1 Tax=Metallococcus carri TaxID=1656884 RepID=A0A967B0W4_9MICO|nr:DUF3311 domain-containing protein [Metallococcus carri]NHN56017.1 DUF3311 domain-containing protein [Metallococcus carri]NOP37526.1 DUF3311 domain-containing protein [Calidifontibacter sp. DB2511S]
MRPSPPRALHLVLAAIPFVMMLLAIPFVNRTEPFVLGLPFFLFWIVLAVVITAICMTTVYLTDPANKRGAEGDQ